MPADPSPELPPSTQVKVHKVVGVMSANGLFKPEAPDPALLFDGLADNELSARPDDILSAMEEVQHYHPDAKPEAWMANLVLEHVHAEQFEAALQHQVNDIVRLGEGALQMQDLRISLSPHAGTNPVHDVYVRMTLNGESVELAYRATGNCSAPIYSMRWPPAWRRGVSDVAWHG